MNSDCVFTIPVCDLRIPGELRTSCSRASTVIHDPGLFNPIEPSMMNFSLILFIDGNSNQKTIGKQRWYRCSMSRVWKFTHLTREQLRPRRS